MQIRIHEVKLMRICADLDPGYIFSVTKSFFLIRQEYSLGDSGAQPAPPHQLLGPVPGEPLLRTICIISFMVGSVFRIRIPDISLSPEPSSGPGFPEYGSNLNPDSDPDPGHLSVFGIRNGCNADLDPGS